MAENPNSAIPAALWLLHIGVLILVDNPNKPIYIGSKIMKIISL
jgi:hypothetical protein